jgi:TolA-binding protein
MDRMLLAAPAQNPAAPLHSESPGLILDRLSILALKLYHTAEESHRASATEAHRQKNLDRLALLEEQRTDLAACLETLWKRSSRQAALQTLPPDEDVQRPLNPALIRWSTPISSAGSRVDLLAKCAYKTGTRPADIVGCCETSPPAKSVESACRPQRLNARAATQPTFPASPPQTGTANSMKTSPPATAKRPRTLAGVAPASADNARAQTLALYEAALRLMQEGKYEKAHAAFNQMLASSPADLAERIRMYINACLQQISKGKTSSSPTRSATTTPSPCSTTATTRTRAPSSSRSSPRTQRRLRLLRPRRPRQHDRRRAHLPRTPHRGHPPQPPKNRIQARADSDFQDMADDPRFTELLYPEV